MRLKAVGVALVTVVSLAASAQAQILCVWAPSDLPLPAGKTGGAVFAAAPNGYLAGEAQSGGMLVWRDRQLTELQSPPGKDFAITAVNGRGEVVGYDLPNNAAFVHRDGAYQLLPSPAGQRAIATGINESGDIAGYIGDSGGGSPYRAILWKRSQPGTYQIIADGEAMGIDDAGRVVIDNGVVWSPDGTTIQLAGYPNVTIELFQRGHVLGRVYGDIGHLREWDVTGVEVRRHGFAVSSPMGINTRGQLATWYFKYGDQGGNTLGVWRRSTFAGDVGPDLNVYAVTETHELAGRRKVADGQPWVPATWTCT